MEKLKFTTTSTFGLEAVVKREVAALGGEDIQTMDGRVDFFGDISSIPKFNIWLRSADRLLLNIGEFKAYTFDELFEKTKALNWGDWIPKDGKFTITGKSVKSTLFSVSDCQSIVKKAIVEKLKLKYNTEWFEETGPEYKVQVALLKDTATLTIDTSGAGLHKRGYRRDSVIAPIKETLAAGLISLSYYRKNRVLFDPFCGSGTIPIEAALIAKNIAPGIKREFVSEQWPQIDAQMWKKARKDAYSAIDFTADCEIYGFDCDSSAIELSKANAKKAGVDIDISFSEAVFPNIDFKKDYAIMITNPPYGERLGDLKTVLELYKQMGIYHKKHETMSAYVITSNEEFEKAFGERAHTKRKLFNGRIKTDYYQYFGEKPPRA